jgi:hypothetical protein
LTRKHSLYTQTLARLHFAFAAARPTTLPFLTLAVPAARRFVIGLSAAT